MTAQTDMDEDTLEALEGSIRKWRGIAAGTEEDRGAENCPLCQLYNGVMVLGKPAQGCTGCPIQKATGKDGCAGTPYDDYDEARFDLQLSETGSDRALESWERMHKAAVAEVGFLESLRPKRGEI